MAKSHSNTTHAPQRQKRSKTEGTESETSDTDIGITVILPRGKTSEGLAEGVVKRASFNQVRDGIWTRSLLIANRFRVIRTLDIAACCFPERGFKAALTAAQRAVRGLVKAGLLNRYRTDRFMTVYLRHVGQILAVQMHTTPSIRCISGMPHGTILTMHETTLYRRPHRVLLDWKLAKIGEKVYASGTEHLRSTRMHTDEILFFCRRTHCLVDAEGIVWLLAPAFASLMEKPRSLTMTFQRMLANRKYRILEYEYVHYDDCPELRKLLSKNKQHD